MAQDDTASELDTGTDTGTTDEGAMEPAAREAPGGASRALAAGTATSGEGGSMSGIGDLSLLGDIPVDLSMEIGRTRITIAELLGLGKGSVVELQRMADEPLDILVNGTLVAHGEAVVVGERFGIRLTDVISPGERLGKLA